MKNRVSKFLFVLICCSLPSGLFAEKYHEEVKQTKRYKSATKADEGGERCRRAQGATELNINNVRARIGTGGNMWYDGSTARYFVPKDGNSTSLYCAALWVGGTDETGQLRLAAMRFGQSGDDFWPGPLKNDNSASTDASVCNEYDRHFKINKAEVESFLGMCDRESGAFVGDENEVADIIKNWPAHVDKPGYSKYLAPFYDANGDGVYNWRDGDYPYYDIENALCPKTLKANLPPGGTYTPAPGYESIKGGDYMNGDQENYTIDGQMLVDQVLKGDQTLWWVFNDKGNTHTESKGEPIGLEIRAQAFAFSTNNEINNMTFYSYEIVNRSTYRLSETYFSQWVDPDLGYAADDYVGCDVERGLGYCYNGKLTDGPGTGAYTGIPPAVGIDFFQGPYMDPDGRDNPKINIKKMREESPHASKLELSVEKGGYAVYDSVGNFVQIDTIRLTDDAALYKEYWYFVKGDSVGNCAINGVNFGNGIVDDERFGMRRFVYYNNDASPINGEPSKATDYYNYLRGFWRNNTRMTYGGPGYNQSSVVCDFMFPGKSDIWGWGTNGESVDGIVSGSEGWTEQASGNAPGDRRFMQSAGPFTLEQGAVNYITVGIPWAKASSGDQYASVDLLKQVDDKCQALFDNCFKLVDGPDAPGLTISPLANKLILYLSYENENSNNYKEKYREIDNTIDPGYTEITYDSVVYENENPVGDDTIWYTYEREETIGDSTFTVIDSTFKVVTDFLTVVTPTESFVEYDRYFTFEGYQIYQLKDKTVSASDINDITKAKLVAQCDIENYDPISGLAISKLVNYETDNEIGGLKGTVMVTGANAGIQHSFEITEDLFATTNNKTLVNNKEYYYIAVAYAHNNFKTYNQTDPSSLDGQKEPYLRGRKNQFGAEIQRVVGIPADPSPRDGGTVVQSVYGDTPEITRIEGFGNGGLVLSLKESSINNILNNGGNPYPILEYEKNAGPLNVVIVDPLNVVPGEYNLRFFMKDSVENVPYSWNADSAYWKLTRVDGKTLFTEEEGDVDELISDLPICYNNEQLVLQLGFSVKVTNPKPIATNAEYFSSESSNSYDRVRLRGGGDLNSGDIFFGHSMIFEDPADSWLQSIPDVDAIEYYNWIRSGSQILSEAAERFIRTMDNSGPKTSEDTAYYSEFLNQDFYYWKGGVKADDTIISDHSTSKIVAIDPEQKAEDILGGTWAPYKLASYDIYHPGFSWRYYMSTTSSKVTFKVLTSALNLDRNYSNMYNDLNNLASTQIVFTADKSKWTRCPVIEMSDDYTTSEGNARRFQIRKSSSIDKNGKKMGEEGCNEAEASIVSGEGMGWFPGYAINLETGERLNVFYGEDSRYSSDMMWNPTSSDIESSEVEGAFQRDVIFGGRHYIYVLGANNLRYFSSDLKREEYFECPAYDEGKWAYENLRNLDNVANTLLDEDVLVYYRSEQGMNAVSRVFANVMWVNMPMLSTSQNFTNPSDIPTDVTVKLHVRKPYQMNYNALGAGASPAQNENNPFYMFKFDDNIATLKGVAGTNELKSNIILDKLTIVPNPYYNRSGYELDDQIQTTIKITNLLEGSVVSIYTLDGTLVRRLDPCPPNQTYLTWDLLNHTGQSISGGMYLFHIKVPKVGEKVLRWFGSMRPVDINSYPMD